MTFQSDYSFVDRLLHRFAFATWPVQAALADMEEVSFRSRLAGVTLDRPVFVAGLPRAGTTLILELIENSGEFASYQYRDMPFLLTPMLWSALTKSAERKVEQRERAHGDGVAIDIDSPEAFEEVVWRSLYPQKYGKTAIEPWKGGVDPDKQRFFSAQMRKIVAIRTEGAGRPLRYLSKCNGNIARFATISAMFSDAVILAPYRRPLDQAASLLRQHQNFLAMHAEDSFSREYMGAIGHYDFGANLKPINFDGWLSKGPAPDFGSLNGWLRYWSAAYGFLLEQQSLPIRFFSYDALCQDAPTHLASLESLLGLSRAGGLTSQAARVRPLKGLPEPGPEVDQGLLEEAVHIFERLEARRGGAPLASGAIDTPTSAGA
jgi:hypothetical protein